MSTGLSSSQLVWLFLAAMAASWLCFQTEADSLLGVPVSTDVNDLLVTFSLELAIHLVVVLL